MSAKEDESARHVHSMRHNGTRRRKSRRGTFMNSVIPVLLQDNEARSSSATGFQQTAPAPMHLFLPRIVDVSVLQQQGGRALDKEGRTFESCSTSLLLGFLV